MLLTLASRTEVGRLIGLNRTLAHLETIHSHVHLHLFGGLVPHLWLRWSPCAPHLFCCRRVLFLLADVRDCRVEVLPERLYAGHVLALAHLFVAQTNFVGLLVNIRRELLLVKVVNNAVNWIVFS